MNTPKADLYRHNLIGAIWRKASASGAEHNCVEVTDLPSGARAVRDSKNPHREPLRFTATEWTVFQQDVIAEEAGRDGRRRQTMNISKADLYRHDLTGAIWRKASTSGGEGNCVEVTDLPGGARAVRDSKNPHREPLRFTATEWAAFRQGVIAGEL